MNFQAIAVAEFLLNLIRLYMTAGLIFSIPLMLFGLQRLDPYTQWERRIQGLLKGLLLRGLLLPGLCIFWPMFIVRLWQNKGVPLEQNAHRKLAKLSRRSL